MYACNAEMGQALPSYSTVSRGGGGAVEGKGPERGGLLVVAVVVVVVGEGVHSRVKASQGAHRLSESAKLALSADFPPGAIYLVQVVLSRYAGIRAAIVLNENSAHIYSASL